MKQQAIQFLIKLRNFSKVINNTIKGTLHEVPFLIYYLKKKTFSGRIYKRGML